MLNILSYNAFIMDARKKLRRSRFNADTGRWECIKAYNYCEMERKLKAYFEKGGIYSKTALAGLLGVTYETIRQWLKVDGKAFNREFAGIIELYYPTAVYRLAEEYRAGAFSEKAIKNIRLLERLGSHVMDITEKTERKQKVDQAVKMNVEFKDLSDEELEGRIADIEDKLESV